MAYSQELGAQHIHRIIIRQLPPSSVDLGGFAKRVAVEETKDLLRYLGIKSANDGQRGGGWHVAYLDGEEGYKVNLQLL